jgi:hypothetical protein
MSQFCATEYAWGVRWADPASNASWLAERRIISERDRVFPTFS